ncbi:hypothetical protein M569_12523, partial [Genlisea aurea]
RGVGLLNFDDDEVGVFKGMIPAADHTVLRVEHADENLTWESFFPEWIDEEMEAEIPICPNLPEIEGDPAKRRLDLIAVKLPCRGNWSRDVARLHLQTAAAAWLSSRNHPAHLLFLTRCFPIPNLFTCKDLLARYGSAWIYRPRLELLREKLRLPIGSCELALSVTRKKDGGGSSNRRREAYATILHSGNFYVCGAIAAARSIRLTRSDRDLVILVDDTIGDYHRSGLESAGWKVKTIQRIRNPKAEKDAYNEWNYSKFRLWQLTEYDRVVFIDADLLLLRNIDFLFAMPEISATGNNGTLFNSGVMVIEPSDCTFRLLMDHVGEFESYNGGDQGYLNEVFTWWHRIPKRVNFLKDFWHGDDEAAKRNKIRLFEEDPPRIYALHYLGTKPWMCFRDYDCNWNVEILHEFASDAAHRRWWAVHDSMPEKLQEFCLLPSKQKAQLEWDRIQAEKANFSDGHWKIGIEDGRIMKCIDPYCEWRSMLSRWGEKNWTETEFPIPTPPAL